MVVDNPPPRGVKVILKSLHGGAIIGQYYEGGEFIAWCPLPSFDSEMKQRIRKMK